ncbi:hypothetical protein [Peredibacter starrii]|uniref:Uncharacterized protein n=1 Tax=Peredibacter starrii TaxID=28202 RepID=A0AAX4HR94_9BACT|nr:hypothetical protein [Peredibacter starrii]WPU65628.1 hypothetical protein SOO65_02590 [Peredibacter starrii]
MAGERFNYASLLTKLRFDHNYTVARANGMVTADFIDAQNSGYYFGGVWQITTAYYPTQPANPFPVGSINNSGAVRAYIHTLVRTYAVLRTFNIVFEGAPPSSKTVKAYWADISRTSYIANPDEINYILNFNGAPGVRIGDDNFITSVADSEVWAKIVEHFSNRLDGTFNYCHTNVPTPPPCHASRGRR